jgi:hypothetical protein
MSSRRSTFTKAEIIRAVQAALSVGLKVARVEVKADAIVIISEGNDLVDVVKNPWDGVLCIENAKRTS